MNKLKKEFDEVSDDPKASVCWGFIQCPGSKTGKIMG